MTDLTIFPADIAEMSVSQLAALSPAQKQEINRNLDTAIDWLKKARIKFDAALEQSYGEQARAARIEAGKDFGAVHFTDGPLRITVDAPKRVTWDQAALADFAQRIAATGDKVGDFIDIDYSISESRFNAWPMTLKETFVKARTVKPGKTSYRLALVQENFA